MSRSFTDFLNKLAHGHNLDSVEASEALGAIIRGEVSEPEIAAFLFGMRQKGETLEEMTAFTRVMRDAAVAVDIDTEGAVDVCGTGGDQSGTVNISTAVMFVAAGAGVPVLKHGNRSVSSHSGSVDVLEHLGANPLMHKEIAEKCFEQTGMTFMFAPYFHPAMKHVVPVRKALRMRTFFNVMGPLLNPAGVKRQVIGAFNVETARMIAGIMSNVGMEHVHVVHSDDGLDELTVSADSTVFKVLNGSGVIMDRFSPLALGFDASPIEDLKGGDAATNALAITELFLGRSKPGLRDTVLLNAAYAIVTSGKTDDLVQAVAMARESLHSGAAATKLKDFVECTRDINKPEEAIA
jgi:anthranilate phosphoribosyltransferase